MNIFYPIFYPVFKFPSKNEEHRSEIKFMKNKAQSAKDQVINEHPTERLVERIEEDTFGGIDSRIAQLFFRDPK